MELEKLACNRLPKARRPFWKIQFLYRTFCQRSRKKLKKANLRKHTLIAYLVLQIRNATRLSPLKSKDCSHKSSQNKDLRIVLHLTAINILSNLKATSKNFLWSNKILLTSISKTITVIWTIRPFKKILFNQGFTLTGTNSTSRKVANYKVTSLTRMPLQVFFKSTK